ncbi:MAG TPA: hypothetical protein VMP00_06120 [Burkholderiales bacterium]|nr:hypothetical protein [Burkholderiales bacterium]
MDRGELSRRLTYMAANVVADCHVELALGWLLCNRRKDALPGVPSGLHQVLIFVRDQGVQEVEDAYKGRDYFEDCLRMALRNSYAVKLTKARTPGAESRTGGTRRPWQSVES